MGMKLFIKGAAIASAMALFGASSAVAQACTDQEFSSKTGQLYSEAEKAFLIDKNFSLAAQKVQQLRTQQLNCYERSAVTRLSAGINIELKNYPAAVRDLESVANSGGLPAAEQTKIFYNIGQLYLSANDKRKSLELSLIHI